MKELVTPLIFTPSALRLLDQRVLPAQERYIEVTSLQQCSEAIRDMVVRGAPCIGFTAIYGLGLWAQQQSLITAASWDQACDFIKSARPTAVNLMYEVERCRKVGHHFIASEQANLLASTLINLGNDEIEKSFTRNLQMAKFAAAELETRFGQKKLNLMTHCNTGYLACGTIGTALGVVTYLNSLQRLTTVWVDETRPFLQGARLTSFELQKQQIAHQIVVEGCASHLMRNKMVDAIFVGADRIVRNGDTANKIGTATLATVAHHYGVPFFVVAPVSTFDLSLASGNQIEIESRDESEILCWQHHRVAPQGARAFNPSFDVTDFELISAIICENGVITSADQVPLMGRVLEGA